MPRSAPELAAGTVARNHTADSLYLDPKLRRLAGSWRVPAPHDVHAEGKQQDPVTREVHALHQRMWYFDIDCAEEDECEEEDTDDRREPSRGLLRGFGEVRRYQCGIAGDAGVVR